MDARVVVASVDTYLRFAEAVNRLDLTAVGDHTTLPQMVSGEWREDGSSDSSDESRGRRGSKEKSEGRGELDSGSVGIPSEAVGGGEIRPDHRMCRVLAACLFEPGDRLICVRLQEMHVANLLVPNAERRVTRAEPDSTLDEGDRLIN